MIEWLGLFRFSKIVIVKSGLREVVDFVTSHPPKSGLSQKGYTDGMGFTIIYPLETLRVDLFSK